MNKTIKLTPKLFLFVASILLINIFLVWLLGSLFLEDFYLSKKKNEVLDSFKSVKTSYDAGYTSILDLYTQLQNQNMQLTIIESDSGIITWTNSPEFDRVAISVSDRIQAAMPPRSVNTEALNAYLEGKEFGFYDNLIITMVTGSRVFGDMALSRTIRTSDSQQVVMLGRYSDAYFLLQTPLQPIREAAAAAINFTMIAGGISFAVGIVIALIFAYLLTRPIRQMTHIARNLAELNFSEYVNVRGNDEVGELGNSINQMSDALQRYIFEVNDANTQLKKDIDERLLAEKAQKSLVSNISHELKTPLSLISGYAEGLKIGLAEDALLRDEYCDVILEETQKMTRMIHKLLKLARLQSRYESSHKEIIDISEMALEMAQGFSIQAKNVIIETAFTDGIFVRAEREACEQTLGNFLQNAVRHVQPGGRISVSLLSGSSNNTVRLEVMNTGSSVSEENMNLIWDSFYRGDQARNRDQGEVGLGLSIVKAHMLRHGMPFGAYNTNDGVVFYAEFERFEIKTETGANC